MSIWDLPDLKVGGDFISFNEIGDVASGTIVTIRAHRWDDGSVAPQIFLTTDDGDEKTVTAGQIRLKAALAEQRPEAGDHIKITLTDIEKRAGGKTLKIFDVVVTRGNGTVPAPVAAAPAVAAPVAAPVVAPVATLPDPAALAAAMAALTPEQKQALGIPA